MQGYVVGSDPTKKESFFFAAINIPAPGALDQHTI